MKNPNKISYLTKQSRMLCIQDQLKYFFTETSADQRRRIWSLDSEQTSKVKVILLSASSTHHQSRHQQNVINISFSSALLSKQEGMKSESHKLIDSSPLLTHIIHDWDWLSSRRLHNWHVKLLNKYSAIGSEVINIERRMYSHHPSYRPLVYPDHQVQDSFNLQESQQHNDYEGNSYHNSFNRDSDHPYHDKQWNFNSNSPYTEFVNEVHSPAKEVSQYSFHHSYPFHYQEPLSATSVIVKRETDFKDDTTTESTTSSPTIEAAVSNQTNRNQSNNHQLFYSSKFSLNSSQNHGSKGSSLDDEVRRRRRRERNKVAATKCRIKKKEHVINLNVESMRLESSNCHLKATLKELKEEESRLMQILSSHDPFCVFKKTHGDLNNCSLSQDCSVPQNNQDDKNNNNHLIDDDRNYRAVHHHIDHNDNHCHYFESWRTSQS